MQFQEVLILIHNACGRKEVEKKGKGFVFTFMSGKNIKVI